MSWVLSNPVGFVVAEGAGAVLWEAVDIGLRPLKYGLNAFSAGRPGHVIPPSGPQDLIPSPEQLISCFATTDLTWNYLAEQLSWHGVFIGNERPNGSINGGRKEWNDIVKAHLKPPPAEGLFALKQLGRVGPDGVLTESDFQIFIRRHGYKEQQSQDIIAAHLPFIFTPEQARILYALEKELPGEEPARPGTQPGEEPARAGTQPGEEPQKPIDPLLNLYHSTLAAGGMPDPRDQARFEQLYQTLDHNEWNTAYLRDYCTRTEFIGGMIREGFTNPRMIALKQELRAVIPNEADLIRFAVRNVYDQGIAYEQGLDGEYFVIGGAFHVWSNREGLFGSPYINKVDFYKHFGYEPVNPQQVTDDPNVDVQWREIRDYTGQHPPLDMMKKLFKLQDRTMKSWDQAFWRAHWIPISPEQSAERLQRQRPYDSTKHPEFFDEWGNLLPERIAASPDGRNADWEHVRARIKALYIDPDTGDVTPGEVEAKDKERDRLIAAFVSRYSRMPFVPGARDDDGNPVPIAPYTIADHRRLLRAQDLAPNQRDGLAGIAFFPMRLIDIRWAVRFSMTNDDFCRRATHWNETLTDANGKRLTKTQWLHNWAREQFLDRGQLPENAQTLATIAIYQGEMSVQNSARKRRELAARRIQRYLERAYKWRRITRQQYRAWSSRDYVNDTFRLRSVDTPRTAIAYHVASVAGAASGGLLASLGAAQQPQATQTTIEAVTVAGAGVGGALTTIGPALAVTYGMIEDAVWQLAQSELMLEGNTDADIDETNPLYSTVADSMDNLSMLVSQNNLENVVEDISEVAETP